MKNALVSFSRLPVDQAHRLGEALKELTVKVAVVVSYQEHEEIAAAFPEASHLDQNLNRSYGPWAEPFDNESYKDLIDRNYDAILPLFERLRPYEGGSMEADLRAQKAFAVATCVFDTRDLDMALFLKTPESGLEYMLYRLARQRGIPTLFTCFGAFVHARTCSTDFEAPLLLANRKPSAATVPLADAAQPTTSPQTRMQVGRIRTEDDYSPEYMRDVVRRDYRKGLLRQVASDALAGPVKALGPRATGAGPLHRMRLLRAYQKVATDVGEGDFDRFTVYFPLHFQPEMSTMPLGGAFVNQIKAIKMLADAMPANGKIFVKEHPSVFQSSYNRQLVTNTNFRPPQFYHWLAGIKGVRLVAPHTPSNLLQRLTAATATITGSAGLEALIIGKPVLIFGFAPYLNAPGAYRISTSEDIRRAIGEIGEATEDVDDARRRDMDSFLAALDSICLHREVYCESLSGTIKSMQGFFVDCLLAGLARWRV